MCAGTVQCTMYNEHWALILFSDICVFTCYFICSYTLTIPPPHAHAPPLLPSGPTSPVFSSSGHKHCGRTPPLDHGRAAVTPKIGAQKRQLGLSLWLPLPAHIHTGQEGGAYICVCVNCILGVCTSFYVHVTFFVSFYECVCVFMLCLIL